MPREPKVRRSSYAASLSLPTRSRASGAQAQKDFQATARAEFLARAWNLANDKARELGGSCRSLAPPCCFPMQVHIFRRMCGRFDNLIARDAYRGLFKADRLPKSNFPLRYNVAPTDQIPIVRIDPRDGEREVVMARRGWSRSG